MKCRIDLTDKVNRLLVGIILLIGAFWGANKYLLLIVGGIQFLEGLFNRCALSCLITSMKKTDANEL